VTLADSAAADAAWEAVAEHVRQHVWQQSASGHPSAD